MGPRSNLKFLKEFGSDLKRRFFSYFFFHVVVINMFIQFLLGAILHENSKADIENLVIVKAMNSLTFRYTLVAEISISAFLVIEVVIDNLTNFGKLLSVKASFINLMTVCFLFLSNLVILVYAIPYNQYYVIYMIHNTRAMVAVAAICGYARYYGASIWRSSSLKLFYLVGCAGFHLAVVAQSSKNISFYINFLGSLMNSTLTVYLLYNCYRWLRNMKEYLDTNKELAKHQQNCTIYVFYCIAYIFFLWAVNGATGFPEVREFSLPYLMAVELSFSVYAIAQSLHQSHLIRKESLSAQEELEFKRMFVRYISHEVRTPLNTAIMGLQVLFEEMSRQSLSCENVENLDTVNDIRTSCDIAVNVLNELLTFDKLEGGTLMLEKSEVRAMELVEEVVHPFQIQARQSGVTLFVSTNPNVHPFLLQTKLRVDRNKIEQVLRNLVSNGLKFTPSGGSVTVHVDLVDIEDLLEEEEEDRARSGRGRGLLGSDHISSKSLNFQMKAPEPSNKESELESKAVAKMLRVSVTDTGAGISPENQKRLFKEIVQFNPGKLQKGGGSGLGLYISYGITSMHRGMLAVHSRGEGHGSTFTLTLPTVMTNYTDEMSGPPLGLRQMSNLGGSSRNIYTAYRLSERRILIDDVTQERLPPPVEEAKSISVRVRERSVDSSSADEPGPRPPVMLSRMGTATRRISTHRFIRIGTFGSLPRPSSPEDRGSMSIASVIEQSDQASLYGASVDTSGQAKVAGSRERKMSSGVISGGIAASLGTGASRRQSVGSVYIGKKLPKQSLKKVAAGVAVAKGWEASGGRINEAHEEQSPVIARLSQTLVPFVSRSAARVHDISQEGRGSVRDVGDASTQDLQHSLPVAVDTSLREDSSTIDIQKLRYQNMRILIVDDAPLSRKMQCRLLKRRCKECVEAENGKVAVDIISGTMPHTQPHSELVESEPVDLIIMDSNMPVMTGLEAAKKIRAMGYTGIIIGVTGNVTPADIQTFLNHGADAVLPKPINIEGFDLIIHQLIADNRL